MAIARVIAQDATGTGATSASATYPSTPTAGNLLVGIHTAHSDGASGIISPGWIGVPYIGTTYGAQMSYKIAGPNEPTTISSAVDASSTANTLSIFEYSGFKNIAVAELLGTVSSGTASAIPFTATAVTSFSEELLFAFAVFGGVNTLSSWSNSFTTVLTLGDGSSTLFVSQRIISSIGSYSTTATTTPNSAGYYAYIVGFRAKTFSQGNYGKYAQVGDGISTAGVMN